MTELWKPTEYGPRGFENQFYNLIFHGHDLCCGCNKTTLHILALINQKNNKKKLSLKELRKIECHLTGEDPTEEEDNDGVEEGLLDLLFTEDAGTAAGDPTTG